MKTAYHKSCMVIILFLIMFMLPISVVQAQQAPEVEWEKTFSGSGHASGFSVQQTTDGGYIIAGETDDSSGNADVYLIKTDASGNKTWEKTFSGSGHASGFQYSRLQMAVT